MDTLLSRRLAVLGSPAHRPLLSQGLRGIERETLRVDARGKLAQTAHPRALGAALTHPQITTDYAETLLEFITPAEHDVAHTLDRLALIHRIAHTGLNGELLWSQSMPCELPPEEQIAIAWYGTSHMGMLKHVYRRGLALRYGKAMQCIAGIHYNYSLPEQLWQVLQADEQAPGSARHFQSESYIALIRNFRRYSWLLMYLFGASPALSTCFLQGRTHQLQSLSADTLYLPYATSLRMSDLGYQNDAQSGLTPQENSLDSYVHTLSQAVTQPYPPYAALGTRRDGQWIQISTNVLQIENEYYSTIRPKRVIRSGERPIQALCDRGVQYIEVRCLDIDPFEPVGINLQTGRFMDAFLLFCALNESPAIDAAGSQEHTANFSLVVKDGRRPGLNLQRNGVAIGLQQWGLELLENLAPIAAMLDSAHHVPNAYPSPADQPHQNALAQQRAKLDQPALTPSARVLAAMAQDNNSFGAFGMRQSAAHAAHFLAHPPSPDEQASFNALAAASLAEQAELERVAQGSFEEFVAAYLDSSLCKNTGQES